MNSKYIVTKFFMAFILISLVWSCHKEDENIALATFPTAPEVFIDGFSGGLDYFPFDDSRQDAFSVDAKTFYEGSAAMRFDVPNAGDPLGGYAGAIFPVPGGRDLSGYDALTFWAQASQAATLNEVGFGNDFAENKHVVTLSGVQLTTNWRKYIVPLPDPSKLTQEKGLLWYSEAPENEKGYSFWMDEVKYEKLGTLEQPKPAILAGQNQTLQSFIGVNTTLGGLTQTYTMEGGEEITVSAAPSYFTFATSNAEVATVSELGVVTVIGAGTATISAKLGSNDALGSLIIESLGDFTPAPVPTRDASTVISIFSDAYDNVPVNFFNGYFAPFQTTQGQDDIDVGGDKIIKYTEMNFVATEFTEPTVNASAMTHFHLDIQIEDEEILPEDFLKIQLGDFGPDGTFDGGDDSNGSITLSSADLRRGEWISLDIPLSDFSGLSNKNNLAQIFFISDGTNPNLPGTITDLLVDNMYFYSGEEIPKLTLPIDFENGENLTGAFDNGANGGNADNPDQSGINTSGKVYQFNKVAGAAWYSGMFNLFDDNFDFSQGTTFKTKIWSPKANVNVRFQLEKEGGDGNPVTYFVDQNLAEANTWVELIFDFSSTDLNTGDGYDKFVIFPDYDEGNQNPVDVEAIYYLDDISQTMESGTGDTPSQAAPEPMQDEADVISIYSDSYMNVDGSDYNPDWGQGTVVTAEMIDGNNVLLYSGLNFQGLVIGSSQNVTEMEFLHIDYWTANSDALNAFLISTGPVETGSALSVPTSGNWASVDIPLGEFSPVDLMDVIQMKFDGSGDVYLDNIYFYKTDGGGDETMPTVPAPNPAQDAANVISIYSDAYPNVEGSDYNPDWGQATVVTGEMIDGNNMLLYTGLNYQGLIIGSSQNVTEMEFLHIDYWTANSDALNAFLISTGPVETGSALSVPSSGNWASVDIPLGDFSPVDLMDVIQMKFDGNGDIYLDNIYFYKVEEQTTAGMLPVDFEDGSSLSGTFDNGANGANADNPDQSGINTSSKVYQFNKIVGSAWYSGMFNIFPQDIDPSKGTTFKFKIWSPNANINVRIQLEKEGNQGPIVTYNLDQTLTEANQWVELTFDLSTTALNLADGYDKIVIFPDFNEAIQDPVATEAVYYVDDIVQE